MHRMLGKVFYSHQVVYRFEIIPKKVIAVNLHRGKVSEPYFDLQGYVAPP